ncbi:MAG: MFS transporter [Gemmatimonadetes bacterium]|nr:MFS transporter [Gemmatimonadota bacterium]
MNDGRIQAPTRREIVSWALYDFANSAFTTLVVTFIFSAYYAARVASDPIEGAIWWTRAVQASAIIIALIMPVLGAMADYGGRKKRFLLISTVLCVFFTAALFWMGPGDAWIAALIFVFANVAYEATQALYNAFLPELSTRENIGRVSGFGWGLGYFGGLLCLAVALGMVSGWIPETDDLNVRSTNLLTAVWFLVFSIPMFVFLRERQPPRSAPLGEYVRMGFGRVRDTFRNLREYRHAIRLLIARLIYNDGLVTIFAMAAIYAGAEFGMGTSDVLVLGIVVNVAAGISAIAFGFLNDRIGGKRTIAITLVALIGTTVLAFVAREPPAFWTAAIFLGLMVGPNQAASRSLLGSFVPESKQGELFGLYAFSGKLASVLGPLSYGLVLDATRSHRWALASILVFFVIGLALLARVDEAEGIAMAEGARL